MALYQVPVKEHKSSKASAIPGSSLPWRKPCDSIRCHPIIRVNDFAQRRVFVLVHQRTNSTHATFEKGETNCLLPHFLNAGLRSSGDSNISLPSKINYGDKRIPEPFGPL